MIKKALFFIVLALFVSPIFAKWEMKKAPLMTKWASEIDIDNPFPEYPRPQMVRGEWKNLNGLWEFQGGQKADKVPVNTTLKQEILVPFAMESAISGVMEYHDRAWYRRTFDVPSKWEGRKILLHLDAVDWESEVYINGKSLGVHKGGYDQITYDIAPYLKDEGSQELIVRIYDPTDDAGEPRGKQTLYPGGIMYTSVSGIWQSVWLEPVAEAGIKDIKIVPNVDKSLVSLKVNTYKGDGVTFSAKVKEAGKVVATLKGDTNKKFDISIPNQKLWSPKSPFLYDLEISVFQNGIKVDEIESYFGMRKISIGKVDGYLKMLLNDEFVFQMGPLDQGWWPDGLYTAPTDEALKYDIEKTIELGFNMTRKHIKVEPARWYYWADKLGIMVWQDMPSINSYTNNPKPIDARQYKHELRRMVETHWNSPSIIMWVVFNEFQGQHDTKALCEMVKHIDPTRLVNQGSGGGWDDAGDVYDIHSYPAPGCPKSDTMAVACGEYGGIGFQVPGHLWNVDLAGGNYTKANNAEHLLATYDDFINSVTAFKTDLGLSAAVYTEITDVENECNGLMTYDRVMKADVNRIKASNLKAINGKVIIKEILPTSMKSSIEWKYTTDNPPSNWFKVAFDDSGWKSGPARFGNNGSTKWNSSDIWIRRDFELGSLSAEDLEYLVFMVWHDEDCEIYLNGVLAAKESGFTNSYLKMDITKEAKQALKQNDKNTISVHCSQTIGGQDIDVGISTFKVIEK